MKYGVAWSDKCGMLVQFANYQPVISGVEGVWKRSSIHKIAFTSGIKTCLPHLEQCHPWHHQGRIPASSKIGN